MKIGIISDTHGYVDPQLSERFGDCDEIWHAGDFGGLEVAEQLEEIAPLKGVYGNIDDDAIRQRYPEHVVIECAKVRVLMTHIAGRPHRFNPMVRSLLLEHRPQLLICGHSHIPQAERDETRRGLFCINPGAAGHQGFHQNRTVMVAEFNGGQLRDLQLLQLGARGIKK